MLNGCLRQTGRHLTPWQLFRRRKIEILPPNSLQLKVSPILIPLNIILDQLELVRQFVPYFERIHCLQPSLILLGFSSCGSFVVAYDLRNDDDLETRFGASRSSLPFELVLLRFQLNRPLVVSHRIAVLGVDSPVSICDVVPSLSDLRVSVTDMSSFWVVVAWNDNFRVLSLFADPSRASRRQKNVSGFVCQIQGKVVRTATSSGSIRFWWCIEIRKDRREFWVLVITAQAGLECVWWEIEEGAFVRRDREATEDAFFEEEASEWWRPGLEAIESVRAAKMTDRPLWRDGGPVACRCNTVASFPVEPMVRELFCEEDDIILVDFEYCVCRVVGSAFCLITLCELLNRATNCRFRSSIRFVVKIDSMTCEFGERKVFGEGCLKMSLMQMMALIRRNFAMLDDLPEWYVPSSGFANDNLSMFSGRSQEFIQHPWLPVAITRPEG